MKKRSKAKDAAYDKKHGIKEGSKKDKAIDNLHGVKDRKKRKLSYGTRAKMPKKEFALPGKRNKGKGGYPIPDKAHARNALARVSQFGSPAEKKAVRAKVHAKFPDVGKSKKRSAPAPKGARKPFGKISTDTQDRAGQPFRPNVLSKKSNQNKFGTGQSLLKNAMRKHARAERRRHK